MFPCRILSFQIGLSVPGKLHMASSDLTVGIIFLSQTIVGFLGNFFLLYHYSFLCFTRYTLRSTDLIIKHLAVANSVVILFKGIPQSMAAFVSKHSLSDTECKLILYVHRVGRGVSMGSTCLLSVFQAITISPRDFMWAELKLQVPKYIGNFSTLCWILNMLVNIHVLLYMCGKCNCKNSTKKIDYGYCSGAVSSSTVQPVHYSLLLSYDVLCLGLMIWARSSMVFILLRHKQRVQHIHGTSPSPRPSPESRITQSILVLVSTFVSFFTLSSVLSLYTSFFHKPSWWLVNTSALITSCFPTISPFLLMSRNLRIPRLTSPCYGRNAQFPELVR